MNIEVTFSLRNAPGSIKEIIDVDDIGDDKEIRKKLNSILISQNVKNSDGKQIRVDKLLLIVAQTKSPK